MFCEELIAYFSWYGTDRIENDASNTSTVACVRCPWNVFTSRCGQLYLTIWIWLFCYVLKFIRICQSTVILGDRGIFNFSQDYGNKTLFSREEKLHVIKHVSPYNIMQEKGGSILHEGENTILGIRILRSFTQKKHQHSVTHFIRSFIFLLLPLEHRTSVKLHFSFLIL
jgi:hypothetical protein